MKNRILTAAVAAVLCGGFTACGPAAALPGERSDAIQIVCTNFPEYDWVRQLTQGMEELYEITYLPENGADLHNYQPAASDLAKIAGCDLLLCVGGESEYWIPDALSGAVRKDMQVVRMLDCVEAVEEETVEGMEAEEDAEDTAYDEHVWLSLMNASRICAALTDTLCTLDAAHEDVYRKNLTAYQEQLAALHIEFSDTHDKAGTPVLIFADRFPFRYFAEDYGYTYYAAFAGCSAETEANFETITFLAKKIDETGAGTIFIIEGGNAGLAETVISSTQDKNQSIASLNSIQSVTMEQIKSGTTYLSMMEDNLNVLKEAAGLK